MWKQKINWIFVAGCGHTGTTLLSTILSESDEIFCNKQENGQFLLYNFFDQEMMIKHYETTAAESKKHLILEKTPRHVWHIDYIQRTLPRSKFILTIREPRATINSLYKRTNNLESSIRRYQDDAIQVLRKLRDKNCIVIRYEDLIDDTENVVSKLCNWVGIRYQKEFFDFYKKESNWFTNGPMTEHEKNRNLQLRKPIYKNEQTWIDDSSSKNITLSQWYEDIGNKIAKAFGYII